MTISINLLNIMVIGQGLNYERKKKGSFFNETPRSY